MRIFMMNTNYRICEDTAKLQKVLLMVGSFNASKISVCLEETTVQTETNTGNSTIYSVASIYSPTYKKYIYKLGVEQFLAQDLNHDLHGLFIVNCNLEDLRRVAEHVDNAQTPVMVLVVIEKSKVSQIKGPVEVTPTVDTTQEPDKTKKNIINTIVIFGLVIILAVLMMWR